MPKTSARKNIIFKINSSSGIRIAGEFVNFVCGGVYNSSSENGKTKWDSPLSN